MRSPSDRAALFWSLLAGLCLCVPERALAYRCAQAMDEDGLETGPSLSWRSREIPYAFYVEGTSQIEGELEFEVLRESFAAWHRIEGCAEPLMRSDISFYEAASLSRVDRIGYDFLHPEENENLVIFRDEVWPIEGARSVLALTTTTYKPSTGEILDADIELNTANFRFGVIGEASVMDLMNTTVHEVGHVLGLGHSEVAGSTMEPYGATGETEKRTLACDDRDAVVFKYPEATPNGYCADGAPCPTGCLPPDELARSLQVSVKGHDSGMGGCGCATGAGDARAGPLVLAGLMLLRRLSARRARLHGS